jgi:hypothetical protein
MDSQVKLWHLIVAAIGLLIVTYTMVYNRGSSDAEQNIKIEFLQKQMTEMSVNMTIDRKESKERDDRMLNMLIDIQMNLKDKQDRKR